MLTDTINQTRTRSNAVPRAHVRQLAAELRHQAIEARAALDGARKLAWQSYCHHNGRSPGCWPFWRCLPRVIAAVANRGQDYTAIRGYDLVATAVASEFPEWEGRADDLWEFLAEPYERLPTIAQFEDQAREILQRMRNSDCGIRSEEQSDF